MTRRAGASGDRLDRDFTPDLLAVAIVRAEYARLVAAGRRPRTALDLGCGDGAFSRAWAVVDPDVVVDAVDIDPDAYGLAMARERGTFAWCGDAVDLCGRASDVPAYDVIVGNPAFRIALELTHGALDLAPCVTWLLPALFVTATKKKSQILDRAPGTPRVTAGRPAAATLPHDGWHGRHDVRGRHVGPRAHGARGVGCAGRGAGWLGQAVRAGLRPAVTYRDVW